MLIDFVSAGVALDRLDDGARAFLRSWGERILRFDPSTGEILWEIGAWDTVRSDSHQIAMRVGARDLWVQGSPCRVLTDGCNVFGSGPAARLDLPGCLAAMAGHACRALAVELPSPVEFDAWRVTRVDVTSSFALASLAQVRAALLALRACEGGRYRVDQTAGDSVYWSKASRLRSGKAYAKGPHIAYMLRKGIAPRGYSAEEQQSADRLLRLELKLAGQWWRERAGCSWHEVTADRLRAEWQDYFLRMVGTVEIEMDEQGLQKQVMAVAATDGRGRSAYGCWLAIQVHGWELARELYTRTTWYRHLAVLRDAGLGDADIAHGRVQPLRRSLLEAREVHSWEELREAA